jgi:6-phosphofructokinase 1
MPRWRRRAFGSCRVKLKSLEADRARYDRLLDVLAHDVRWFLYNGGNDSADRAEGLAAGGRTRLR